MTYSNEILQERNARNNRAWALFITLMLHGLVLGTLFFSREPTPQDKQEVANLDSSKRGEKP